MMREAKLRSFVSLCRQHDAKVPDAVTRGIALLDVAHAATKVQPARLLDMSVDEARERIADLAIRHHNGHMGSSTQGMTPGVQSFAEDLLEEIRLEAIPELDEIVVALRPKFDEHAKPLMVAAQQYGLEMSMTSDQVIDMDDAGAVVAWRDARDAWSAIKPIAHFRTHIARTFGLSPTAEDADVWTVPDVTPRDVNPSVLFAAGSNWAYDGAYNVDRKMTGELNWLSLAAGGLHLNTHDEVRAKIAARP